MNNNVTQLPRPQSLEVRTEVAKVLAAEGGEAQVVVCADGSAFEVGGHLGSVEALAVGDSVLVACVDEEAVVIGRLRRPYERPAVRLTEADGRVQLEADKAIKLSTGSSTLELTADGRISVDGKQIYSFAEGRLVLQGATIELN